MGFYAMPEGAVDFTDVSTTQKFTLGMKLVDSVGTVFQYVKATGTRATGDVCGIDSSHNLTASVSHAGMGSGATPSKLGVPQVAFTNAQYGWVAVQGPMNINILASCVQSVKLYTSGTNGSLDDTSASQTLIPGVYLITTIVGAALSACYANLELSAN